MTTCQTYPSSFTAREKHYKDEWHSHSSLAMVCDMRCLLIVTFCLIGCAVANPSWRSCADQHAAVTVAPAVLSKAILILNPIHVGRGARDPACTNNTSMCSAVDFKPREKGDAVTNAELWEAAVPLCEKEVAAGASTLLAARKPCVLVTEVNC